MTIGVGNPADEARSTTTRPVRGVTGINQRRFFSDSLNTQVTDHDLNDLWGQIRAVIDFAGITDVEGDDTLLRQAVVDLAGTISGNLAAFQGLSGAAGRVPYFTSASAMNYFGTSEFSRELMPLSSSAQWRTALGIDAALSANVIAFGDLSSVADSLPYFTGSGTMALTTLSAFARTLLDDANVGAARTTLGLGTAALSSTAAFAAAAHTHAIADTTGLQTALDLKAPLASPALTGTPTAPTQAAGNNTTRIATTAYVQQELTAFEPLGPNLIAIDGLVLSVADRMIYSTGGGALAVANLSAFGRAIIDDADASAVRTTLGLGTAATAAAASFATAVHTHAIADVTGLQTALDLKAPLASPVFTGTPIAPTQTAGNNSTRLATTEFVQLALSDFQPLGANLQAIDDLVLSVADRMIYSTGSGALAVANISGFGRAIIDDADAAAVRATIGLGTAALSNSADFATVTHTHIIADVTGLQAAIDLKAPLNSPTFTGIPLAPTQSAVSNNTRIATTQFVTTAVAAAPYLPIAGGILTGDIQVPAGSSGDISVRFGGTTTGFYTLSNRLKFVSNSVESPIDWSQFGIGIDASATASIPLTVQRATAFSILYSSTDGTDQILRKAAIDNVGPRHLLQKSRGSFSAPTVVVTNDILGELIAQGYDGATFSTGSAFRTRVVAATPSGTNMESELLFLLTPAASISPTEIMSLRHATGLNLYGVTVIDQNRHPILRNYTHAGLPAVGAAGSMVFSTTDPVGAQPLFSDGTFWRRVTDKLVAGSTNPGFHPYARYVGNEVVTTSNRNMLFADFGKLIMMQSASAQTFTVVNDTTLGTTPANGSWIDLVQDGAGLLTIVAGAGVTLRMPAVSETSMQYWMLRVTRRAANDYYVTGQGAGA